MIWVLLALVVIVLPCVGISIYVGWNLTHPKRQPLQETPEQYGLAYEDVSFPSRKGDVTLSGWYIPAKAEASHRFTVILSHGYGDNREQYNVGMLAVARTLSEAGYRTLLYDFRNAGQSGGSLTTVGERERHDLLGAVDWLKNRHPQDKIGLIGFSMGATTSLLAAAEEASIVGVVADSHFQELRGYLKKNLTIWSNLPDFPFTPLIIGLLPMIARLNPDEVNAYAAVDRIYPRPVLFIHSIDDKAIPYTESESMYAKHTDRFEFWKTETADHVGTYKLQPEQFMKRVLAFFDRLH